MNRIKQYELPDELATGVLLIDDQHKELIARINRLQNTSLSAGNGVAEFNCLSLLSFLLEYVIIHFHDEEALMAKAEYPHLEAHKKMHAARRKWVEGMAKKFKQAPEVTGGMILEMNIAMTDWLFRHIKNEDKKISRFLAGNAKSISPIGFGMWKDREDLGSDSAAYVRKLRSTQRIKK